MGDGVETQGPGRGTPEAGDGRPFVSGFVPLLGRPNVGKSTLCNRLVGEKVAITSPLPQTTRHRIAAVLHLPGAQVVLLDTPGLLRRPRHLLDRTLVQLAAGALAGADVACLVVDASVEPGDGDRRAAGHVGQADCPRLLVLNKIDRVRPADRPAALQAYRGLLPPQRGFAQAVAVSALTGEGLPELVEAIRCRLPPGPAYFPEDTITDQPEQLLAAELVREQALRLLREEVPHAVAVLVEEWRERPGGLIYIRAIIFVERDSQKGIVIGRGGSMLRAIGQAARAEIERRLGTSVYLDLWVKVKEDWRDRPGSLQTLGLRGDGG